MSLFRSHPSGFRCCLMSALLLTTRTLGGTVAAEDASFAGPVESQSEEGGPSGRGEKGLGHSSKIDTRNNSPALNNFLEDVLSAQEELKWIDRAVHRQGDAKDSERSSRNSRKNGVRKSRGGYNEQPPKPYKPERIYPEEDTKTKRETERNENSSSISLASLKRTIIELSDSLDPRGSEEEQRQNEDNVFESKRKLLWSEDLKSPMGFAIEYYDYEDSADSVASLLDNLDDKEVKQKKSASAGEDSRNPLAGPPNKFKIPKKDENSAEEEKEERERKKLKNKYPKQEFISDTEEDFSNTHAPSSDRVQDTAQHSPNSRYNSMVVKRIPAAPESEDSEFYTQCASCMYTRVRSCSKIGSFPDGPVMSDPEESLIIDGQNSLIYSERSNVVAADDEPNLSAERSYLVISPGFENKRSKKRSIDPMESSFIVKDKSRASSDADKSARNYLALKITDDMFKGGVEQSNPLSEDKPIESASFSSSLPFSSSASGNSLLSLIAAHNVKTTSPEWKVIEAGAESERMVQPKKSMPPDRVFVRRLTQIIYENPPSHTNFSSASLSPPTDNLLYSSALTHRLPTATSENFSDIDVTTHEETVDHQNNSQKVFHINSSDGEYFSIIVQPLTTTRAVLKSTTMVRHDSISMNESKNKTRLRRHAGSYGHEVPLPKRRRDRVEHENDQEGFEGRKRQSVDGVENDSHHPKLSALFAADNIEDESQIDLAAHGELAGKIVERIFQEVQRNEGLKVALGPGLYRNHKPQESIALDKTYRQGLDEDEIKETEAMMRRVMELLGRLVLDEVRRKTCVTLAPDMRDFLRWSLGLEELAEPFSDEVPLPRIPENGLHDTTERQPPSAEKYLFPSSADGDLSELERKVALLKSLINEYRALTEREKTKVQTVHDYLVRQLALLMNYIESKEAASQERISEKTETGKAKVSMANQHILQYQGSAPNRNSTIGQGNEFNMTDNEASNRNYRNSEIGAGPAKFVSYSNEGKKVWSARRKRKHESPESDRARRERSRDRSSYDEGESLEYRKLLRRIATLRRKKRDNSWGYEVPRIYSGPMELPSLPRVSLSTVADLDQPVTTPFAPSVPPINSSSPVRGKNRLEDEVLLLNKREAWRKENERMLEEVAFGKDTRNDLIRLFNGDEEVRIKRAFDTANNTSPISSTTSPETLKTSRTENPYSQTENLSSVEKKINVLPVEYKNS